VKPKDEEIEADWVESDEPEEGQPVVEQPRPVAAETKAVETKTPPATSGAPKTATPDDLRQIVPGGVNMLGDKVPAKGVESVISALMGMRTKTHNNTPGSFTLRFFQVAPLVAPTPDAPQAPTTVAAAVSAAPEAVERSSAPLPIPSAATPVFSPVAGLTPWRRR
jgi:hypothetical protein